MSSQWILRSARLALAFAFAAESHACELCRKSYYEAMEAAPKASALHPAARVVEYKLTIAERTSKPAGAPAQVLTINGTSPGPVLRFREGDVARITVTNGLADDTTSLHWHGVLVPNLEDGVPVVTTPIIAPGKSRTFEFLIRQHGTYWYHSHTGHQEQRGVYGAIVIEPKAPLAADHDQVVVLSDWTDEHPAEVQRTLLRGSDWYSYRKGTAQSLFGAYQAGKLGEYLDREKALVPPMDLSDVAYDAFLMNGMRSFRLPGKPGETIRVRLINAGAASYFYLDAAAGPLKVVAADGQDVVPFEQKRLLIGPAETYDLLMKVPADGSSELRATAQDGSGSVSAWLGQGAAIKHATPPPAPERYGMNAYLTSILDQLDPEPGAKEPERPISPYAKLRAAAPHPVAPSHRELTLKLTGDMIRYEWSFDGLDPHQAEAIKVKEGETLRVRLVNNTMMHHPIHFHGHFFRLVDAADKDPATSPLKHTVDVPPMSVRTIEFTADEGQGDWLIHCHLLYHHITGMVRTIRVTAADGAEPPHPAATHSMPTVYAWGQASFTTAAATGNATIQSGRDNLYLRWEEGMRHDDGHERELSYARYIDTRLSLVAGYRFDSMEGGRDGPFAGISVRLPYFIDLGLTHQSGGETRGTLMKSLQLTDRLSLDLSYRHGRLTHAATSADLRYLLTKQLSLTAGYSSDFGTGIGLLTRF